MIENINSSVFIDKENARVFVFNAANQHDVGKVEKVAGVNNKIKKWGSKNTLPNEREELLMENNLIGAIISAKTDILLGQGLYAYKEHYDKGERVRIPVEMPADWSDTFEKLDIYKYLESAIFNLYKHGNILPEFIENRGGRVIALQNIECKYFRALEKVKGQILRYAIVADWKEPINQDTNPISYVDAYDPNRMQFKYVMHHGDRCFHDGYYYHPSYWGGKHWIEVSNSIPIFHKHNIDNGYMIRFHITYPHDMFLNAEEFKRVQDDPDAAQACRDKEASAKQAFIEKINEFLAGAKNAGRAIFTPEFFDPITKMYHGIKINPIEIDLKDEALIKLYEASNQANIAGQALHPTLANIESQGKLSSGSEIRNAFLFYLLTKTYRPRSIVLKALEHVRKRNNLSRSDLKLGFEDLNISKLSDDKSGVQKLNQDESQ